MLNGLWLVVAGVWPLLLAGPALARRLWWLPPLGAMPALLIAFAVPLETRVELPWLLLGTQLGLDTTGRIFLVFTAMLWLAAGVFAATQRWRALVRADADHCAARFNAFFLLAMGGNFWLILGLDLVSFYLGFAVMGLAAYILVIHDGTQAALRAGKVYLIMALVGEVLLFAALAMIAAETGSAAPEPHQLANLSDLAIALALLGLGGKAGIFPLHLWLPLAHPAAPMAASAVLSGAMIKVALLGWLRFLPVGVLALPYWGTGLILLGLFTVFFGLVLGLMQRDLKVILAYSSISKMGFLLVLLGLVLLQPVLAPVGVAAIALIAGHHGLVKGGLFLGVGLRKHAEAMRQPLILGGLGFLALAMIGAPLTIGAVAKDAAKPLLAGLPPGWPSLSLGLALTLATMVTTALMARFVWIAKASRSQPLAGEGAAEIAWALLIQAIIILPFALAEPKALVANGLPVVLGLGLVATVVWLAVRGYLPGSGLGWGWVGRVPPGDLLHWLLPIYRLGRLLSVILWFQWQAVVGRASLWVAQAARQSLAWAPDNLERELRGWSVLGALWLAVGAVMLLFLLTESVGLLPQGTAPHQPPIKDALPQALAPHPSGATATDKMLADPWVTPEITPEIIPGVMPGMIEQTPPEMHPEIALDNAASLVMPEALPPAPLLAPIVRQEMPDTEPLSEDRNEQAPEPEQQQPARDSVGEGERAAQQPLPPLCQSDAPFVFAQADDLDQSVELTPCIADSQGALQPLVQPELSNRLVLLLQRNLEWLGYDPGSTDGMIGPATRDAIRAFQQNQGMRSTGGISFKLLQAINREIQRRQDG